MDKWGALIFLIFFLIIIGPTIVRLFRGSQEPPPSNSKEPTPKYENLDKDKLSQGISEALIRLDSNESEKRKDLLIFLTRWHGSKQDLFNFLNNNLQSFEEEIGRYRFDKLFVPLNELKICNCKRVYNGNLICDPYNKKMPYDKRYIEDMIRDVKKGCQGNDPQEPSSKLGLFRAFLQRKINQAEVWLKNGNLDREKMTIWHKQLNQGILEALGSNIQERDINDYLFAMKQVIVAAKRYDNPTSGINLNNEMGHCIEFLRNIRELATHSGLLVETFDPENLKLCE